MSDPQSNAAIPLSASLNLRVDLTPTVITLSDPLSGRSMNILEDTAFEGLRSGFRYLLTGVNDAVRL